MLLILPGLIALGNWQMHRYHEKVRQQQQIATYAAAPPTPIQNIKNQENKTLEWRKVTFSGTPVVKHLFLLDHRWHDHQPGYALMSIVKRPDQLPILVQWGWIAKNHPKTQAALAPLIPQKNLVTRPLCAFRATHCY